MLKVYIYKCLCCNVLYIKVLTIVEFLKKRNNSNNNKLPKLKKGIVVFLPVVCRTTVGCGAQLHIIKMLFSKKNQHKKMSRRVILILDDKNDRTLIILEIS